MSFDGEQAIRAAMLVALRASADFAAVLNGVHDGGADAAPLPHMVLGTSAAEPWGGKALEGVSVRVPVAIADAGEGTERIGALMAAADAALEAADASGDGWQIVTMLRMRSRIARGAARRWGAVVEYRVRAVRG